MFISSTWLKILIEWQAMSIKTGWMKISSCALQSTKNKICGTVGTMSRSRAVYGRFEKGTVKNSTFETDTVKRCPSNKLRFLKKSLNFGLQSKGVNIYARLIGNGHSLLYPIVEVSMTRGELQKGASCGGVRKGWPEGLRSEEKKLGTLRERREAKMCSDLRKTAAFAEKIPCEV